MYIKLTKCANLLLVTFDDLWRPLMLFLPFDIKFGTQVFIYWSILANEALINHENVL